MAEVVKKPRKKTIPSPLKRLVWNKYIGEEIGKTKCTRCKQIDITQMSFYCGHKTTEIHGGELTVDNLQPICQKCNSSIGKKHTKAFKASLQIDKFIKEDVKQDLPDVTKIEEFKSEHINYIKVINILKLADTKARSIEKRKHMLKLMMQDFSFTCCITNYQKNLNEKNIPEYEQISLNITNLENAIISMNEKILGSKTDVEFKDLYSKFTIEKQNLIKLSEELKIRWKITEPFNW